MPYSGLTFDDVTDYFIQHIPIQTMLDLGAGGGKFGRLVRQYHPAAHLTGVEVMAEYIERFNLTALYDRVLNTRIQDVMAQEVDIIYDLVVLGDVIEHLPKSTGLDVLHFYMHRARYLLILYPEKTFQGTLENNPYEAHVSIWSRADFAGLDAVYLEREGKPPSYGTKVLTAINGFMLDTHTAPPVQAVLAPFIPHSTVFRAARKLYRSLLPMPLRQKLNLSRANRTITSAQTFTPPVAPPRE